MKAGPLITLHNLQKIYHPGDDVAVHALRGVWLQIERGDFVAIMGASGSGKSTLMNIIGCLDTPSSGVLEFDGTNVAAATRAQRAQLRNCKIGFVFQSFNLLSRTTALENVELPMFYARPIISLAWQRQRALAVLRDVGLEDRARHRPSQLSGGQQQRIAIARALVNKPDLLLADEPTGNLDTRTSMEIMDIFQKLNDSGITIVMVTHELEIAAYARRMVVMRDGMIIRDSPNPHQRRAADQRAELDQAELTAQLIAK